MTSRLIASLFSEVVGVLPKLIPPWGWGSSNNITLENHFADLPSRASWSYGSGSVWNTRQACVTIFSHLLEQISFRGSCPAFLSHPCYSSAYSDQWNPNPATSNLFPSIQRFSSQPLSTSNSPVIVQPTLRRFFSTLKVDLPVFDIPFCLANLSLLDYNVTGIRCFWFQIHWI